ncbi:MAG: hypothetical protein PGN30_00010 [Mycolicibacterium neoaurum]|uniref:hypothetical protein n=1 Tax=Mycolicibacterium neoaurum TaxID=1795 RepID=UPI002FFA8299
MAIHPEPSPLSGKTVTVDLGKGEQDYHVEDYWDRVTGGSWMYAEGNPAALQYAIRAGMRTDPLPIDNEVLYGKIGPYGQLVHTSEVVAVESDRSGGSPTPNCLTAADAFITADQDPDGTAVTFKIIEDESGDIFWVHGHVPAAEFIGEINRWLTHTLDEDEVLRLDLPIDHLWAKFDDENHDRFKLVEKPWLGTKEQADRVFPVTRLLL